MIDFNWLLWGALVLLLALSGFFSMSETALVRADRFKVRHKMEEGHSRAGIVHRMLEDPDRILSTVLVGNNLVNIAAASIATYLCVDLWGPKGAIAATFGLTFIVLVFAEITPKTLAVDRPVRTSMHLARPLRFFHIILAPFAHSLTWFARLLLKPFKLEPNTGPYITQDEIEHMVKVGAEEGEVEAFEQRVIEEVFDFTETDVHRVITPREEVVYVDKDAKLTEALHAVAESGHSRILVVDGSFDHVLGFVHAKDLLTYTDKQLTETFVTDSLRSVLFAHHETHSDRLLARMQRERKLMAVVQNEDGRNLGIATVEDLVEELIGEIRDEFDEVDG
ncbi:MAG: hemolysin family protein [Thermoplasmatota archaeon]